MRSVNKTQGRMLRRLAAFSAGLCAAAVIFRCGDFAVGERGGASQFAFRFRYGTLPSPGFAGKRGAFANANLEARGGGFTGGASDQDLVRILVLDLSAWKSWEDLTASPEWKAYEEERERRNGTLGSWAGWVGLLAGHFPVLADEPLPITEGVARGKVPGVLGLNGFICAFFTNGEMTYWGEGHASGVRGESVRVTITLEPVGGRVPDPFVFGGTVDVGLDPQAPVAAPAGEYVYISNFASDNISVFSTATQTVVSTLDAGDGPQAPVFSEDGLSFYVACWFSDAVLVFGAEGAVSDTIPLGSSPAVPALVPDAGLLYVPEPNINSVAVIETAARRIRQLGVGYYPTTPAVSPSGALAYVPNLQSNSVCVIPTDTPMVSMIIPVGSNPGTPSITPDPAAAFPLLFVPNRTSGTVSVISKDHAVVAEIETGGHPQPRPAFTPDGRFVYVSDGISTIFIISTETLAVTDTLRVGGSPGSPVMTRDGRYVLAACLETGIVAVIETGLQAVRMTLETGLSPSSLGVSADGFWAFAADRESGKMAFIRRQAEAVSSVRSE